jgi:hypothetical protein
MTEVPTNIRPRWGHFIRSTCRFHTEQLASPTFNCTPMSQIILPLVVRAVDRVYNARFGNSDFAEEAN